METKHRVVSVVTFNVTRDNFARVAREAGATVERTLPTLPGFIDGMLLTNEGLSRIVMISEWKSRQSWSDAQWDEDVGKAVSDLFEDTASYDLQFFYPLVKATAAPIK